MMLPLNVIIQKFNEVVNLTSIRDKIGFETLEISLNGNQGNNSQGNNGDRKDETAPESIPKEISLITICQDDKERSNIDNDNNISSINLTLSDQTVIIPLLYPDFSIFDISQLNEILKAVEMHTNYGNYLKYDQFRSMVSSEIASRQK
jgi:hypothetical protein